MTARSQTMETLHDTRFVESSSSSRSSDGLSSEDGGMVVGL